MIKYFGKENAPIVYISLALILGVSTSCASGGKATDGNHQKRSTDEKANPDGSSSLEINCPETRPHDGEEQSRKPDLTDYGKLALSIAKCFSKLKTHFVCFNDFSLNKETTVNLSNPIVKNYASDQDEKRVWLEINYQQDIKRRKPNPKAEQGRKVNETIPVFGSNGVELHMLLFSGKYSGAHVKAPDYRIGKLKVRLNLRGPCGNRTEKLKKAIDDIIEQHKDQFEAVFSVPDGNHFEHIK